jgi:lipoprotein-anchoring transpeptidase ErfK/SrfK
MILRVGAAASIPVRSLSLSSVALITFLLVPLAPPVAAQGGDWWLGNPSPYPRRAMRMVRRSVSKRAREADNETDAQRKRKGATLTETKPTGPLFAILSLSDQHVSVYNSSGLVTRSKVSTGMPGHRTPMGIFTIIGRERYHSSNIYSGAPMPFMQRITWSGVAMHLGVVPGYPASHGCIRLPAGSAERLWGLTKIGERVVISPHEVTPSAISHPLLPVPKMQPSPVPVVDATPPKVTEVATVANDPLPMGSLKLLNPLEYAQALKTRAAADLASASKVLEEHSRRKEANSEGIRRALAELRAAEAARTRAEAKLAARAEALAAKRDARDIQRAEAATTSAETNVAETRKRVQVAVESPAFTSPEGHEALESEQALIAIRATLAKAQRAAKEAERRLSPVSILVSKKDNKVYMRQGLAPILEAPVTIRNPDTPLGTHVYIATSSDAASLSWSVVSLPASSKSAEDRRWRRGREPADQSASGADRALSSATAAQALERVELPPEVSARISELLWTGSSLIISDHVLSDETSDVGTDLVVTVR